MALASRMQALCRLCKVKVEGVTHIVSLCSVLAGNQYRKRHNKIREKLHQLLCKKFEIKYEDKWFSHQPEPVLQNNKCKILWEYAIQTDKEIEHQSPDILAIDKEIIECKIIAIAIPGDQNIEKQALEKITKYQDLRLQVQKLWGVKATTYLLVLVLWEKLGILVVINCLQKPALVRTAFILRRVLGISESG